MKKKTKKHLLTGLAVAIVVTVAGIMYSVVLYKAEAISSLTETIVVRVFDRYPRATITFPGNEEIVVGENQTMTYDWSMATQVGFTLSFDDQIINSWTDVYGEFEPGQYPSGSNSHAIVLPDYGRYILAGTAVGNIGTYEDSVVFRRSATKIFLLGVEEDGNPNVEIKFDENVKYLSVEVEDLDGNPILAEPIIIDVSDDTGGGIYR